MKSFIGAIVCLGLSLAVTPVDSIAEAESHAKIEKMRKELKSSERSKKARHPSMKEHRGSGPVGENEYVIIDLTGSITRSSCPYTCEDRGLPEEHCRAWKSEQDSSECYVQDTRIPSDVFPSMSNEARQTNNKHSTKS